MITGRAAFSGKDVTDILAAVIRAEPEWNNLPANLHGRLQEVLERCLKKDTKDRYHDISDVRMDLQKVLVDPSGVFVQPVTAVRHRKMLSLKLPWVAAAVVLAAIIVGVAVWKLKPSEPRQVMRFDYELPEGQQLTSTGRPLAVSPDGKQFVYSTTKGLYLRSVDALTAKLIAGTEGDTQQPFFSPDGQWIGYLSSNDQKLKKVAISGGAPVALCDAGSMVLGASWNSDNTIVYSDISRGIMRVSANGGTPESLIKGSLANMNKEGVPVYPQMLPDKKTLLFENSFDVTGANSQIVVQALKSGERKTLVKGGYGGKYLPTGHIVYFLPNNNTANLFTVPFDLDRLEVTGGPVSILEGVSTAAISESGTLIYVPQSAITAGPTGASSSGRTLVWVDRQGKEEPLAAASDQYWYFKISPDGKRVALTVESGANTDIWIWDVVRETLTRLTFDEGIDMAPIWTPDGKRIVYRSTPVASGLGGISWKAADGTGTVEKLGSAPDRRLIPYSWSKDGKTLLLGELTVTPLQMDIGMMSMEGDHARKPLLQGKYNEDYPLISPDGRWMAYQSNESGKYEVYVRPFPDVDRGGRWQVSMNGGDSPLWSPDGRELFYRSGDSFMAVVVETEPTFKPGNPKVLFKGAYHSESIPFDYTMWDINPDGKRFLLMKPVPSTEKAPAAEAPRKINIVLNWFEELKQRVSVHVQ